MKRILYSHGDSIVWGAELKDKVNQRFSNYLSINYNAIDCNNASAGVSNDYIFRHTIRDVSHWLKYKKIWSEENGWVSADELIVVIGWTAPTRFEWWSEDEKYQQDRIWADYDKWGDNDKDRITEDKFVLNQSKDIPSYIRTFNHIIGASSFLEKYKIPYYFFNSFYHYEFPDEPKNLIDKFGKPEYQIDLDSLWDNLPKEFTNQTMYDYIFLKGHYQLLPRKHPTPQAHKEWADFIIKNFNL